MSYTPLHVHTTYSILDGYSRVPDLVKKVKSLGMSACAITDHGTMTGVIPFYNECKKNDITPIIGLEAYFTPDATIKDRKLTYHLILLAMNNVGYHNLLKIDTQANRDFFYKPRVSWETLCKYNEGLIVTSACMGGILNTPAAEEWATKFKEEFGDRYYLEIQSNTMQEQKEYNEKIVSLSKSLSIPLVMTTDAHYPSQEDAPYHKLWIGVNKDGNDYYPTDDFFIQSPAEIVKRTSYLNMVDVEQALYNTKLIEGRCSVDITVEGNHYPVFDCEDKLETVKNICRRGWKEKVIGHNHRHSLADYKKRLNYEIGELEYCNYLNYLLILQDVLDNDCKENDILTGAGRGSASASLVCYLMNITHIDPLEYELPFERFANRQRVTPADIDTDIEDIRRKDVIDIIKKKYGDVYPVRTLSVLGIKGSINTAARALHFAPSAVNISVEDYDEFTSVADSYPEEENDDGTLWKKSSKGIMMKTRLTKDDVLKLGDVAKHFHNGIYGFSKHASAVMVFPDDPNNYCPLELQKDSKTNERMLVTAYEAHDLEAMNLLKLDILGLRNLSIIHDVTKMIDDKIDIYNLPLDDDEVLQQYADGNTVGIFQCESPGMTNLAKRIGVSCFEDIAALVALFRPGPIDAGLVDVFIEGKKNESTVKYLDERLRPILSPTYGVIVYQEEVMKIAQALAGFTMGEADGLRKVIGRKELDKDENGKTPVDYAVEEFIRRAVENGTETSAAEEIGRQIKACGRYIFNLGHSSSYGYMSYMTAWFKHHYPLEYMCSLMNSVIGNVEKTVEYIKECERMGIVVESPCYKFLNEKYEIHDGKIYYALHAIKGIGGNMSVGGSTSSFDAIVRSNNKKVVDALIKSGALDYLGYKRGYLLANTTNLIDIHKREVQCNEKIKLYTERGDASRVEQWKEKLRECQATAVIKDTGEYDYASGEIEVLGWTSLPLPKITSGEIKKMYKKNDKNGNEMAWITIKGAYGEVRATCFAAGWKLIKGKVKIRDSVKYEVDARNILRNIMIDGEVYRTNIRKKWSK